MAERPFKLRVLKALTASLKQITPANGYAFDLSDQEVSGIGTVPRVYRGRAWYGDDDPVPLVSILEGVNPADELFEPPPLDTSGAYDWPLLVQGFVNDDPQNPTDPAYVLMADVRRRLAEEKKRKAAGSSMPDPFGLGINGPNKITKLSIGSGVVRPADDVSARAYFWLSLIPQISENAEQPYG